MAGKIENGKQRRLAPLVVLDLFSGIGSGIIVLKRLSIAIKTVIVVEKDRVATYVTKRNHDKNFNPERRA